MPHFQPAFEIAPTWSKACRRKPTGVVLRFRGEGDHGELYRFTEIFSGFERLYRNLDFLKQKPRIIMTNGKEISPRVLRLVKKHRCHIDVSFVLFGSYFRDLIKEYCISSMQFHEDDDVRDGFERVLEFFEIDTSVPLMN